MWWGGLRGAVGFSLAMVLKEDIWYRCYAIISILKFNHSSHGAGAPYLTYSEN